jgi:hypothetical protein
VGGGPTPGSFFKIRSTWAGLFLKLPARDAIFFANLQLTTRSFSGILSNRVDLFFELPARNPIIF